MVEMSLHPCVKRRRNRHSDFIRSDFILVAFFLAGFNFASHFCLSFTLAGRPAVPKRCAEIPKNGLKNRWPFFALDIFTPVLQVSFNVPCLDFLIDCTNMKIVDDHGKFGCPSLLGDSKNGSQHDFIMPDEETKRENLEKLRRKVMALSNNQKSREERRNGIASMSRNKSRATDYIFDTIKKSAIGSVKKEGTIKDTATGDLQIQQTEINSIVSQSVIQSAIEECLKEHTPADFQPVWDDSNLKSAFSSFTRRFGIVSENTKWLVGNERLKPGSIMRKPFNEDDINVRMATPADDVDIAKLRLSVFSGVSPDLQSQFCSRSCQAIAARRMRGASCIVATCSTIINDANGAQLDLIVGTAECSFHEFFGTQLGRRRPLNSILYVTEVAVNPSVRRKGVALKLLRAIDTFAKDLGLESIYLHVDVSNYGAIQLYEKCGYRKVVSDLPMYLEFTTSLNLHPGATKGRNHFLLCRNLTSDLTWFDDFHYHNQNRELVGTFGFEIPA